MKKIIFLSLISFYNLSTAQQRLSIYGDQSVFNQIPSVTGKNITYDNIQGSPYLSKSFSVAKVADSYEEVPVRYNSYKDEIEFQKNGNTLVLPKEKVFSRIEVKSPKQTFVLLNLDDDLKGYFIELVNGKYSLYKKIKTIFKDFTPAANSYTQDRPAIFKNQDPIYYIKIENLMIKKFKNQKEITEQFPDKKETLNIFFKSNKIKFDKEDDLIKLVNFLNQN
jgi:hypothetical protein